VITDKEIIFDIINDHVSGVDTYHNNGSMWFIFTDDKKWVIELTKDGTLWYNLYFFQNCFKYLSLDVVENQHYITEWVEDTIQNGVRSTMTFGDPPISEVEDIIQNGVRYTTQYGCDDTTFVESVIQNGARSTEFLLFDIEETVEDTIQNGIKHTEDSLQERMFFVEDTIENGIKETRNENHHRLREVVVTLKDGIKDIKQEPSQRTWKIDNVIKETKGLGPSEVTTKEIEKVIKETIELPDKSGELNGYGEYYARQKNRTYPHTDTVNNVIQNGIKKTNWRKVDNHPTYVDHIVN